MDVSAMSLNPLRAAARKPLNEGAFEKQYRMICQELSTLLSSLLRLRLREAKWLLRFCFGTIDKSDASDEEFDDILVRGSCGNQGEDFLRPG